MRKYILWCITMLLVTASLYAQDSYNDRVKKYIDQYYPLAIAEQKSSGIPASITLGQGILETEAGSSDLMTMANNHFGIKCKTGWTGDTFMHDDDAPNECFKKYNCAADSYRDHSEHLKKNPRYAPLFALSQTDYASWAICLKKCGYATNPQYAQRLIKIIEDFKLQDYTYSALDTSLLNNYPTIPAVVQTAADERKGMDAAAAAKKTATSPAPKPAPVAVTAPVKEVAPASAIKGVATEEAPIKKMADSARSKIIVQQDVPANPVMQAAVVKIDSPKKYPMAAATDADRKYDSGKIVIKNGMRAFYALKGEMLLQYAVKYNVRYPRLLEMNDLADAPLPFNTYVYLEKKLTSGTHAKHAVKDGESLLWISQEEGVQMKRLMSLNYLNPNEEPATGAILELQSMADRKPDTKMDPLAAHKKNSITYGDDTTKQDNDYIEINRTPAAPAADTLTEKQEDAAHAQYMAGSTYDKEAEAKQTEAKAAELSTLKAQLDKVVYADDSKLQQDKPATPAPKENKVVEEPVKPKAAKAEKFYKVKRGDTASGIAKKNGITVRQLMKWNDIDADEIRAGQTLRIKQ